MMPVHQGLCVLTPCYGISSATFAYCVPGSGPIAIRSQSVSCTDNILFILMLCTTSKMTVELSEGEETCVCNQDFTGKKLKPKYRRQSPINQWPAWANSRSIGVCARPSLVQSPPMTGRAHHQSHCRCRAQCLLFSSDSANLKGIF